MKMTVRYANHPEDSKSYDTQKLRDQYLFEPVFVEDEINLVYSHQDRIIAGGAKPVKEELALEGADTLRAAHFLERREMGVINIGGPGYVLIDGKRFEMNHYDGLYVGMGTKDVVFGSKNVKEPAKFYLASAPAHHSYATVEIPLSKANKVKLGDPATLNSRTINQYVHPNVCASCQLSMGLTILNPGNVWNTMPCHTHERRMEVYFYFGMDKDTLVFHLMGTPNETRHIVVRNEQAVISPAWSIHAGMGTAAYTFIWAMCGENQVFTDMDEVPMGDLK